MYYYDIGEVIETAMATRELSVDIESSHASVHLDDWEFYGVGISSGEFSAYIPVEDERCELIVAFIWNFEGDVIMHNASFDLRGLKKKFDLHGYPKNIVDTMIALNLLDENLSPKDLGLKPSAKRMLGHERASYEDSIAFGRHSPEFAKYCCDDGRDTLAIWHIEKPKLENENLMPLFRNISCESIKVFADMSMVGFRWDLKTGEDLMYAFNEVVVNSEKAVREVLGVTVNLNSGDQLAKLLFTPKSDGGLGISTKGLAMTKGGAKKPPRVQVNEDTFDLLADRHPVLSQLRDWKFATSQITKYVWKITELAMADRYSRVHPDIWTVSTTGRTRMQNPPNQTITKYPPETFQYVEKGKPTFSPKFEIRKGFKAAPGNVLILADFSAFQLRLNAHIAGDEEMIRAFCFWQCRACGKTGSHNIYLEKCPNCGCPCNEKVIKDPTFEGFWHGADLHTDTYEYINKYLGRKVLKSRQDGKCVDVDSLIVADGQIKRIGSLCPVRTPDTFTPIPRKSIMVGHKERMTSQFFSDGVRPRTLIITNRGLICGTPNHRVMTTEGLIHIGDLKEGMECVELQPTLLVDHPERLEVSFNPFFEGFKVKPFKLSLNADWGYFAGLWIGDGSQSNSQMSVTVGSADEYEGWRDAVKDSLTRVGFDVELSGDKKAFYFGSTRLVRFLRSIGLKPKKGVEILIPEWVFATREVALSFIAGLVDTDGAVDKGDTEAYICMKSWRLASDLCFLLKALNFKRFRVETKWNSVQKKYYYLVWIGRECSTELVKFLRHDVKRQRLIDMHLLKEPTTKPLQPMTVRKILKLSPGEVVDLSIESEDHLYGVDGFVTHNTCNFSLIFGASAWKMHSEFPQYSVDEWEGIIKAFFVKYKGTKDYHHRMEKLMYARGVVNDIFGRKRRIPRRDIEMSKKHALNMFINFPVQSSEGHYAQLAMVRFREWLIEKDLYSDGRVVDGLVSIPHFNHDEIVAECPKDMAPMVGEAMMRIMRYLVPLKVPIDAEMKIQESWT